VAELRRRLDRLDRASGSGPWTAATQRAIAANPGRRAGDLAAAAGRETQPFKLDVRKLKALGLTVSLQVGYRLSPRGETWCRLTGLDSSTPPETSDRVGGATGPGPPDRPCAE
jgi:hypothetical protein